MTIQAGDTAWVLMSTALVMLMTPGLALFYGGLVQSRNVLSTLMQSMVLLCLVTIQWVVLGYTLAFGPDVHGLIGNLDWIFLNGVGLDPNPDYAATIPHQGFMIFQCMFAVITPALITGAFAERIKFKSFILFTLLWTTFVYDPVAHWVWGVNGWIRQLGALDFAGGTVVHILSGISALVAAIMLGKRKSFLLDLSQPHNLPMTVLGAGLLWFGWFGFNGGSSLAANGLAVHALVLTHVAAACGALSWMVADWVQKGKPSTLGKVSGALAGLVAITPAAGFVDIKAAIIIGLVAGLLCQWAVRLKITFSYDDSLDVFGIHGVGGIWGSLATGLFASTAVNPAGANGLFFGNAKLLGIQFIAVLGSVVYAAVVTFALIKIVDLIMGFSVDDETESAGLDLTQHQESAYQF